MNKNTPSQPFAANGFQAGMAALLLTLCPAVAQNAKEQTAPAIPVDVTAFDVQALPVAKPAVPVVESSEAKDTKDSKEAAKPITDYTSQIGNGLKERERRLTLLNEAMMKLR